MAAAGALEMARGAYHYTATILKDRVLRPERPEFGVVFLPVLVYWVLCFIYDCLDRVQHPAVARFRITRVRPDPRGNQITKTHVCLRVLLQHAVQMVIGSLMFVVDPHQCDANPHRSWAASTAQFLFGMLVMDSWQFWIHRQMHVNTWLYKNVHSVHHELIVPYAYGALYNHPVEALFLDTIGAVVASTLTGMNCQVIVAFFTFSSVKTVLDHCGYRFPINPLHDLFPNCAAYHDVHHDLKHIKKNFSQPFFTHWDMLMGSWMDPTGFHVLPGAKAAKAAKEGAGGQPSEAQPGSGGSSKAAKGKEGEPASSLSKADGSGRALRSRTRRDA